MNLKKTFFKYIIIMPLKTELNKKSIAKHGLDFDKISASTKTIVVKVNIKIDIKKLFDFLPITEYVVVPKRRGRKKKNAPPDPNKNIAEGSIITLEIGDNIRGVDLKKKKKKIKERARGHITYFRNSMTVVMIIEGKKINCKVTQNGQFQMTGCKSDEQAEKIVHYIWSHINDTKNIYTFIDDSKYMSAIFVPAMRNIDFDLGFNIDREKLDSHINMKTDFVSILEDSIGYTGVNIKIPMDKPITDLNLKKRKWKNGKWQKIKYITYSDYLELLPEKDRKKKLRKERHHTFLVFHSGKIIMSSLTEDFSRQPFYDFLDIVYKNKDVIEERLDDIIT